VLKVRVTRSNFLEDRQGKSFADVVHHLRQPFEAVLKSSGDADRQPRRSTTGGKLAREKARSTLGVWRFSPSNPDADAAAKRDRP
jgi:hypothetical protein